MPDIKTALSAALLRPPAHVVVQKTINEWDDEGAGAPVVTKETKGTFMLSEKPAPKRGGQIKNNVMRETFNFIMNNPGLTCKAISLALERQGFKASSVTSVVSQLWRSGQLIKNGEGYRTTSSAYKPVSTMPNIKVKKLKKQIEGLKELAKSKGISALPITQASVEKELTRFAEKIMQPSFDPKAVLGPLTVYQARELYDELKRMFGG